MEIWQYLVLLPLGLLAGVSGGLLGIGGSVVMIPGMVLLLGSGQQHLYQATAMIANFFVVAPAVVRHSQAGATLRPVTRVMIPSALGGVVAGVWLSELNLFKGAGQGYLQIAFASFLAYVLIHNLLRLRGQAEAPQIRVDSMRTSAISAAAVGIPTGVLGGLLGIGGGLFAVPAQQVLLRIPLPNAIANSAATILWLSAAGAILKNASLASHEHSWSEAISMAACLIPTAMIGSWFAAGKVHRWPAQTIRLAFVALLLYAGIRVFLAGWGQIGNL